MAFNLPVCRNRSLKVFYRTAVTKSFKKAFTEHPKTTVTELNNLINKNIKNL